MVFGCKVSWLRVYPVPFSLMLTCDSLPLLSQESGWTCRIKEVS